MSVRRLGAPRPAPVLTGPDGLPTALAAAGGREAAEAVEAVAEEWVVEDRWWTGHPLRRRYFELILGSGRNVVVFRDLGGGGWFEQRS